MKLPGGGGPWPGTKFGGGNGGPFGAPFGGKGGIMPTGGTVVLIRKWVQYGMHTLTLSNARRRKWRI